MDVSSYGRCSSTIPLTSCACRFVTLFWPKKVKAAKLEEIHAKMVMKESAPRASSSDGPSASKKPRLSSGAASVSRNGGSVPTSTTATSLANNKYR